MSAVYGKAFLGAYHLDELDYIRHIDYVHVNPLKHGYVERVKDWPYSAFHRYVLNETLPLDWCGDMGDLSTVYD